MSPTLLAKLQDARARPLAPAATLPADRLAAANGLVRQVRAELAGGRGLGARA